MRKEVLTWLGKEFLFLSSEAKPGATATEETSEIFELRAIFQEAVKADIPQTESALVDGYSNPGKLIEIEVTATVE
jgi:hypothetical protein